MDLWMRLEERADRNQATQETETGDYRAKECAEAFKDFLPKLQRAREASAL